MKNFVGHIGGDDFILLFQSENWEQLCLDALNTFSKVMPDFYDSLDVAAGGIVVEDRRDNTGFFPFGSMSIGAVRVLPEYFKSHHEVAGAMSRTKKEAKKRSEIACLLINAIVINNVMINFYLILNLP